MTPNLTTADCMKVSYRRMQCSTRTSFIRPNEYLRVLLRLGGIILPPLNDDVVDVGAAGAATAGAAAVGAAAAAAGAAAAAAAAAAAEASTAAANVRLDSKRQQHQSMVLLILILLVVQLLMLLSLLKMRLQEVVHWRHQPHPLIRALVGLPPFRHPWDAAAARVVLTVLMDGRRAFNCLSSLESFKVE